jgi:hypothetical protein
MQYLQNPRHDSDRVTLHNAVLNDVHGNQHLHIHQAPSGLSEEERLLAFLKPVTAERDKYDVPGCMEETRKDILQRIHDWLGNFAAPNVLYISGSPGAGKSAIASTLVSNLTKRRRRNSHFFFKRGHASLGDPTTLWRTVAFDLARFYPDVKNSLLEFSKQAHPRDTDIILHFECMIMQPLLSNLDKFSADPLVIVLDALDECDFDVSKPHPILRTLELWSDLPSSFKLVVTGRDEHLQVSFPVDRIELEVGDSVSLQTTNDIRLFFENRFTQIVKSYPSLSPTWPGKAIIDQLTTRAEGLFLWAESAMVFMKEGQHDHLRVTDKLDHIIAGKLGKRMNDIDAHYRGILNFHFENSDDTTLDVLKAAVGLIVVAKIPLHRDDLKHFLAGRKDYDELRVDSILRRLSSVIALRPDGTLRIRHPTFAEFLTDASRCQQSFTIDRSAQSRILALTCFQLMNGGLKFNICDLKTSYLRNDDVKDLTSRIEEAIPAHLSYSCRFWAEHLRDSPNDDEFLNVIADFLQIRLLYWLEVLSLIKEVSVASVALLTLAQWINVSLTCFNYHLHCSRI